MKENVRVLALSSGPIQHNKRVPLIGVVARAGGLVEGVLASFVDVNGSDGTQRIIKMLRTSQFREQVRIIALNGIAIAGLNVLDLEGLRRKLGVEVISLTKRKPHKRELLRAIKSFSKRTHEDTHARENFINSLKGNEFAEHDFYFQTTLPQKYAGKIAVKAWDLIRLSYLIARGIGPVLKSNLII